MADKRVRLYLDEHIPPAVAGGLRRRGVDVRTTREEDMLGAADAVQIAHSTALGRVLVKKDADFLHLHAAGIHHAGIVYVPGSLGVGEMIRGLMLLEAVISPEEMIGRVEFI